MKKFTLFLFSLMMLFPFESFSQLQKDGWEFGVGGTYPRLIGSAGIGGSANYGGYISIQRDASEHTSFRMKSFYSRLTLSETPTTTDIMGLGFDFMHHFVPCNEISPYLSIGFNAFYASLKKATIASDENFLDYSFNFALGIKYKFPKSNVAINAELGNHTAADNKLDGLKGEARNILGGSRNSWISMNFGLLYYFGMGENSRLCEYEGGLKTEPPISTDKKIEVPEAKANDFNYPPVYKNSWTFTFGGIYPRFVGTEAAGIEGDYGGFLGIQRDFSEHLSIRAQSYYTYLSTSGAGTVKTNLFGEDIDWLYRFVPCEPLSPYLGFGAGIYYIDVAKGTDYPYGSFLDYRINLLFGVDWKIFGDRWNMKTELGYYTLTNDKLDGIYGTSGGLLGGTVDSYMSFLVGVNYAFDVGEKSTLPALYNGIDKSEKIVEKTVYRDTVIIVEKIVYRDTVIVVEKVVEKIIEKIIREEIIKPKEFVFQGVNFSSAEASTKFETNVELANTIKTLIENPEVKVEIQGHSDNIGTEEGNIALSQQRAEMVRDFLISKGVSSDRLTAKGYGDKQPISDNGTPEGRAQNRRVEIKVIK